MSIISKRINEAEMKKNHVSFDITVRLIEVEFDDTGKVRFVFRDDFNQRDVVEEINLADEHEKVRFAMYLESMDIKNLKRARELLNIFIREEIEIKLRQKFNGSILYSYSLDSDQRYEFKKHTYLDNMIAKKRITKETYEELKDMTYKEVRAALR